MFLKSVFLKKKVYCLKIKSLQLIPNVLTSYDLKLFAGEHRPYRRACNPFNTGDVCRWCRRRSDIIGFYPLEKLKWQPKSNINGERNLPNRRMGDLHQKGSLDVK